MSKPTGILMIALFLAAGGSWIWQRSISTLHKSSVVDADFKACESALMIYSLNAGTLPHTHQGLASLRDQPDTDPRPERWVPIMREIPHDPWGSPYQYTMHEANGIQHAELRSWGPDGVPSADDFVHAFMRAGHPKAPAHHP